MIDKNAEIYTIKDGSQITSGNLSIGTGNFRKLDYVDAKGIKQTGPTAKLWINYQEDTSQNQIIQVHNGQKITVGPYTIRILAIQQDSPANLPPPGGGKSFVELVISSSNNTLP